MRALVWARGSGRGPREGGRVVGLCWRATAARDGASRGGGLGRAQTKTIVERHGGAIACASALGGGSTFTMTLPVESAR